MDSWISFSLRGYNCKFGWNNGKVLQSSSITLSCEWTRLNRKNKQWDKCGAGTVVVFSIEKGFAFTALCDSVTESAMSMIQKGNREAVHGYSFSIGTAILCERVHFPMAAAAARL